ncbi:MAG: bifunctional serine/threonine-protein kinase/formylglycine-generating enzyme family protein, partial [Planctomycetota bacterium]
SPLRRGSIGQWVSALKVPEGRIEQRSLAECYRLLCEVGRDEKPDRRAVSGRELLEALPAYRNKVVGHGSARTPGFYQDAGEILLGALDAAWDAELFLPPTGKMLFVGTVALQGGEGRRAHVLDLTGEIPRVLAQGGTAVGPDIEPHRLYWRGGDEWRSLYPWLLFDEETEKLYCFNGQGRRAEYLDYGSGEILRGDALADLAPTLEADLDGLFTAPPERPKPEAAPEGEHFAEFQILGKLGEGGMGEVYLAEQSTLGRRVALKLLPKHLAQDPVALARFRREVAALSRCEHPNVVKILTSGMREGVPFYAMEYVEGADLEDVAKALSKTGDFSSAVSTACEAARQERQALFENVPAVPRTTVHAQAGGDRFLEVARFFRDAALGVDHLHQHGIIHRDLKPANVMITAADHRAVVMDLGLAAMENASVSLTVDKAQVLGTLRYMPPEQLQRNLLSLDRRADVYSLGATLYELITDRPFFDGDTQARLIEQVLREQPVPIEKVNRSAPRDLATIVRKATDKDPRLRYDTAAELAGDLEAFSEDRPISARAPSLVYVLRMAIRRHKGVAAVVAAAFVVIVVGTIVAFRQVTGARDDAQDNEAKARTILDEVLDLSLSATLEDLQREAEGFDPLGGLQLVAQMEDWIWRGEALRPELDRLRKKLQVLEPQRAEDVSRRTGARDSKQSLGRMWDERGGGNEWEANYREEGQEPLSQLQDWLEILTFEQREWRLRALTKLVEELNAFFAVPAEVPPLAKLGTSLAEVRHRLEHLRGMIRQTLESDDARRRWEEAIADIARLQVYGGLKLEPQYGLLPIGKDPRSGLWEFSHLESGDEALRGEEGRIRIEENMSLVFVLLPAGEFWMGAQDEDPNRPNYDVNAYDRESPVRRVALDAFFLSKYEATRRQWLVLTGDDPADDKNDWRNPVELVSWDECDATLSAIGLELPTEAQWEYGARAGTTTPWSIAAIEEELKRVAAVDDGHEHGPGHERGPVGRYQPNPFGLQDVHGSLWEWCRDEWRDYEIDPRAGDGLRPVKWGTQEHVHRGGSVFDTAEFARSAYRAFFSSDTRYALLGLRPARSER